MSRLQSLSDSSYLQLHSAWTCCAYDTFIKGLEAVDTAVLGAKCQHQHAHNDNANVLMFNNNDHHHL